LAKIPTVKTLYLDNGVLRVQKVLDLGSTLALKRGEKWLAWAKGKPIISKVRGIKGYTFLVCPEIAWTLDQSGLEQVMSKGKTYLLSKLTNKAEELLEERNGAAPPSEPQPSLEEIALAKIQDQIKDLTAQAASLQDKIKGGPKA
jgi:hypothetical protein